MAYLDDLKTARDQIATQIRDISLNPKPSYTIDGQTVSWTQHLNMLIEKLKPLDIAINAAEPYEVQSVGYL